MQECKLFIKVFLLHPFTHANCKDIQIASKDYKLIAFKGVYGTFAHRKHHLHHAPYLIRSDPLPYSAQAGGFLKALEHCYCYIFWTWPKDLFTSKLNQACCKITICSWIINHKHISHLIKNWINPYINRNCYCATLIWEHVHLEAYLITVLTNKLLSFSEKSYCA